MREAVGVLASEAVSEHQLHAEVSMLKHPYFDFGLEAVASQSWERNNRPRSVRVKMLLLQHVE